MAKFSLVGFILLLLVCAAFALPPVDERSSGADKQTGSGRIALIIGNGAYRDSPLRNPPNDAEDIASALRGLGFEVILRRNANQREMKMAIREFGQKLRTTEAGIFYFAGHGLQVKGTNYIVPVGADIQSEPDVEDQAVSLDYVMRTMEDSGAKFSVAVLDACRNNPFARSFRSASSGLASIQAASGMLIAYATAPGSVAADGDGRNGIYTKHLLRNLREGDSDILKVFQRVRTGVVSETAGKQVPWESTSLVGDFHFERNALANIAKAQQDHVDKVVSDAVRVANETAAREKAELLRSMETAIKDALARQRDSIEAERLARLAAGNGESVKKPSVQTVVEAPREPAATSAPIALTSAIPSSVPETKTKVNSPAVESVKKPSVQTVVEAPREPAATSAPIALTSAIPSSVPETKTKVNSPAVESVTKPSVQTVVEAPREPAVSPAPIALTSAVPLSMPETKMKVNTLAVESSRASPARPGDEWEYTSLEMFGKSHKLVLRVKAVSPDGALEELIWDDKSLFDWAFGDHPTVIGTPNEAEFMFGPEWDGERLVVLPVEGGKSACTSTKFSCRLELKVSGHEKLKIAAGTFDAIRLEGMVHVQGLGSGPGPLSFYGYGEVTIWYSKEHRRLLKQHAIKRGLMMYDNTIELSAIRFAPR